MRRSPLATRLVAALTITACTLAACSSDDDRADRTPATPTTDTGASGPPSVAPASTADTAPATAPTTTAGDTDGIAWSDCDEFDDPALECAVLTVPLDHGEPEGDTIDIALIRLPATGDRLGAMLFNPGGPGVGGVDPIASIGGLPVITTLTERYDLIGFDPRGVERSNGIRCIDGPTLDTIASLDPTPETDQEAAEGAQIYRASLEGCREQYGDTLRFMSTEQTARDMDAVREALGDEQISFFGVSYGTYLGAVYASLFPDRVGAMFLDSAFLPDGQSDLEATRIQLAGFEAAFDNFARWCTGTTSCPWSGTDVGARWDALAVRLDATPLDVEGRSVNVAVLANATSAALYSESLWSQLAQALDAAEQGDGTLVQQLADGFTGRNSDGTYNTLATSIQVINCASGIGTETPADPAAAVAELRAGLPRFGPVVPSWILDGDCTALLGGPAPTPDPVSYTGTGPIVVIGGLNDPATPFEYATLMVDALGPAAHLVTFTGEGHGQSLENDCLQQVMVDLFLDQTTPAPGTTCAANPAPTEPSWWGELPAVPAGTSIELPGQLLAGLGLDPSRLYLEGWLSTASPEQVQSAFADALDGWAATDRPQEQQGVVATSFEQDGRTLGVITISPEALAELGVDLDGTIVVLLAV